MRNTVIPQQCYGCQLFAGQSSDADTPEQVDQLVTYTLNPCKLVLMTDKKKRRLLCMRQVYQPCVDELCTYQAFYRICCTQASNKFAMLSGLDKQLLVKLAGLDASDTCAKRRKHQLGSLLQSSQGCQGASCYAGCI